MGLAMDVFHSFFQMRAAGKKVGRLRSHSVIGRSQGAIGRTIDSVNVGSGEDFDSLEAVDQRAENGKANIRSV